MNVRKAGSRKVERTSAEAKRLADPIKVAEGAQPAEPKPEVAKK